MELLDAVQYTFDCLELMKAGKRDLVSKDKLNDVAIYVKQIDSIVTQYKRDPAFHFIIERVVRSIAMIQELKIDNIPSDMKDILVEALMQLRKVVADITYSYYTVNDFDETVEEDVDLLLEVIRIRRGIK